MKRVYFLCTGNSCRSQMAEGYAKKFFHDKAEIQSAGVEQHGLNPRAVKVMAEDGVDISHQQSKLIDPDYFATADLIVTLCGDARDRCPAIPSQAKAIHWPLVDPAKATGTDEEQLAVFRQVRDEIKRRVQNLRQEVIG
ncbi:arsenate reductase (thioredoxin) [Limosilactobacillus caccae]|uniref:arsenate reductase (thioredoxin) n=1 Tax=Limosilactobacillus caccae TaxID=1926284 RepID=UPI00097101FA|nr:arsenate reductase (thioredoxin) [Limosilactobacillus caccae]